MKQKLRILTLSFLLVMQSFFGITPAVFAEDGVVDGEETAVVAGEEIDNEVEGTEEGVTEPDSGEGEGGSDEGNGENGSPKSDKDKEVTKEDEPEAGDGTNAAEGEEENNDSEVTEGTAGGIQPFNVAPANFEEEIDLQDSDIEKVTFKVNGQEVSGTSADVRNGQSAEFTIYLKDIGEDEDDRNYGPGTKLKYPLPTGFAQVFEGISVGGTFGGLGNLSVEDEYIVITLTEKIVDEFGGSKPIENGFFTINAQLSNNNTDWNKSVTIPGGTTITLNFQPKQGTGTTIDKSNGTYDEGANEISWTVIVNTNLNNNESGTVTFTDTLTATGDLEQSSAGHKYDKSSVEVSQIEVTPQGPNLNVTTPSGITPTFTNSDRQMSITLDKNKAYKIVYKTIPDNPGINEKVTYKNAANYGGSPANGTFTKNYGKAIEKIVKTEPSGTNRTTTWKINYNFHNQVVPSGTTLTDSWTISGGSVPEGKTGYLKMENLKIFKEDGTTPWTGNWTPAYIEGDAEFSITFNQNVTEPLVITYETTPINLFATSSFTVTNTARHGHIPQATSIAYQTYSQESFALVKNTVGSTPNYQAKTMDWVITANQAGYNLAANTTFTDTFENENMYLKADTLNVKIGSTTYEYNPADQSATNGVFTLTDNKEKGFTITLVNSTTSQVTISYTTDYVIKEVEDGTGRAQTYPNEVKLTSSSLPNEPTSERSYTINSEQKANGNKTGYYNYETKTFHWEVVFNYNYNTINEAIFKDQLPAEHEINSISVTKGDLTAGGAFDDSTAETVTINDIPIIGTNQIDLNLGTIAKPYKIVYTSKVANDIIPETEGNYKVTNVAELYNDQTKNASWDKTVTVQHTQKVLEQKNGSQIGTTMGIKWNFYFNTAQSSLNNVVIADTFAKDNGVPNQIIDPRSIKVYKVQFNGTNSSLTNHVLVPESEYTLLFEHASYPDAAFILELGDVNEAYYIEYESVFIGLKDSPISNTVEVKYSDTKDDSRSSSVSNLTFSYGSDASTSAVKFVIVKTDADTGEPMKDVEFTLQNRNKRDLLTGKTDENGVLDFGYALATGTYYLKEKPLDGYKSLGDYSFKLSENTIEADGPYEGKQVVEVKNIPLKTSFKVQKVDAAETSKGLAGAVFELQDEQGNVISGYEKLVSDQDGWITVHDNLDPGKYQLVETKAPIGYELDVTPVTFEIDAQQTEIKTLPSISNDINDKSVTLLKYKADRNGNFDETVPLTGAEFTLYKDDGTVVKDINGDDLTGLITNEFGELVVEDLAEGKYYFIETKAPKGYQLDRNKKHEFEIIDGESTVIKVGNKVRTGGGGGGTPPEPEPEDPNKPIDPEDPNKPIDPDKPVDPEDPNKLDPNKPIDPNNPNKPDPNKPIDPNNPNQPGKVGSGGDKNDPQGNKGSNVLGGSDSNDKNSSTGSGEKLPQTGEERNLNLLISGILAIVLGALLIAFRRKTKES